MSTPALHSGCPRWGCIHPLPWLPPRAGVGAHVGGQSSALHQARVVSPGTHVIPKQGPILAAGGCVLPAPRLGLTRVMVSQAA